MTILNAAVQKRGLAGAVYHDDRRAVSAGCKPRHRNTWHARLQAYTAAGHRDVFTRDGVGAVLFVESI